MASQGDPTLTAERTSPTAQVKVQFKTRHSDISLPDSQGPIVVPSHLRRYGLSQIINHLLSPSTPIPFDFLVNGSFLRTSLDEYLTRNGLSSESTLQLEYVRSIVPPLYLASFEHDDCVSAVDVLSSSSLPAKWRISGANIELGQERILSASYDGLLRVWNQSANVLATSPSASEGGHTSSIKCARWLSPSRLVSAGLDRTVRLWNYAESADHHSAEIDPFLELQGHKGPIEHLEVHGPSSRVLTASMDNTIGLWSTDKASAPAAPSLPSSKRRKLSAANVPSRGALSILAHHTAPVSSAIFSPKDSTVAYSTSWDHSLCTTDLVTSRAVDTRTTSAPLLSLAALPAFNLLVAGSAARHIVVIDPRVSASEIAALTLRGHSNAVVSVAASPESEFGFVSAGFDGTCRIWDIRSAPSASAGGENTEPESVYTIRRESSVGKKKVGGDAVKVMDVAWDKEVGIVSGGDDKRVQINRGKDVQGLHSNGEEDG